MKIFSRIKRWHILAILSVLVIISVYFLSQIESKVAELSKQITKSSERAAEIENALAQTQARLDQKSFILNGGQ